MVSGFVFSVACYRIGQLVTDSDNKLSPSSVWCALPLFESLGNSYCAPSIHVVGLRIGPVSMPVQRCSGVRGAWLREQRSGPVHESRCEAIVAPEDCNRWK